MTRDEMVEQLIPKNACVAELGVFQGAFSDVLLEKCQPRELHLIDKWRGRASSGDVNGENRIVLSNRKVKRIPDQLKEKYKNDPVFIHRGNTWDKMLDFQDGYFDAVYVDAGHDFGSAFVDLYISIKKVKHGGLIMGHDYTDKNPKTVGVYKAVNLILKDFQLKIHTLSDEKQPSFAIYMER
jgi:hypothetical protein